MGQAELPDSKGTTPGKILQWITIIGIGLGTLGPYVFPERFAVEGDKAIINKGIADKMHENHVDTAYLNKQFRELSKEIKDAKNLGYANKKKIELVESKVSYILVGQTIQNDIIWEELDPNESNTCGYPYRETNTGDDYGKFTGPWGTVVIYSVDLRSGCRAYYTPWNDVKQLIE